MIIWIDLGNKRNYWCTEHGAGWLKETTAVDDRNVVRAVIKNPKTTITLITANLCRAGIKVSHPPCEEDFQRRNIVIPQDAKHS